MRPVSRDLHVVCLLTDDPANADARISVRKRIWHHFPEDERRSIEAETAKLALSAGIPVYTGDIKDDWFRSTLADLRPDAVMCCGFGQLVDAPFLRIEELGVYNFHPADLANGFGAGPAPYEDSRARDAATTCWTVHLMNEAIDDGHILGSSPPINIRSADGAFRTTRRTITPRWPTASTTWCFTRSGRWWPGTRGPDHAVDADRFRPAVLR